MKRVVVEVLDSHGRVRDRERLVIDSAQPRFTVGRGVAADVMLDDPFVAILHAQIHIDDKGELSITDLDSRNGVLLGDKTVHGAQALLLPDGSFGVGRTRLKIRTENETLAPERMDNGEVAGARRNRRWWAIGGVLICLAFVIYNAWLAAPQDVAGTITTALIGSTMLACAWVAAWGFVTRVIQGEWHWLDHAAIFFATAATMMLADLALDIAWFSFSLPALPLREIVVLLAAVALALFWHLRGAAHIGVRRAATVALLLPVLVGGGSFAVMARNQARNVNYIEIDAQIFPPAWRLRAGGDLNSYFGDAARLKEETDRKRRAMTREDGDESGEDGEDF
ncbi:MAG: FHA domain-containing protein [Burkholderiales bacterium]